MPGSSWLYSKQLRFHFSTLSYGIGACDKSGNSGHESRHLPHIFLLGTVQVLAEQTFLYITKITSWRFQQRQLSQFLVSYQNPPIKKLTQEETL